MSFPQPNADRMVVRKVPHHSVEQTVDNMRTLAWEGQTSPLVRKFAIETLRRVKPKDTISEVGSLYHACCREIHYLADPIGAEFLQHPEVTVNTAAGDCDDMSILLASTLLMSEMLSVGVPCRYKLVGFRNMPLSHVFLEARIDGRWIALDPVAGSATSRMLKDVTTSKIFDLQ
jgi:transglutaminase-like putative cysteine protease